MVRKSGSYQQEPSGFEFPTTLETAPEITEFENEYNDDGMDQKIEDILHSKYGDQIHYDCAIIRFVIGYRHGYALKEYDKRLKETEDAFVHYLKWKKGSNFYDVLSVSQLNGSPIKNYLDGNFVYGANKYGHPLWWQTGLLFRKNADNSHHEKLNPPQRDHVVAWFAKLLHEMKFATNKYYGLPTGIEDIDEEEESDGDDDQKQTGNASTASKLNDNQKRNDRTIGIYKHCIIIDLMDLNVARVLKDREVHEYYAQMGSLVTPEVVFRMYMINASFMFTGVWKIVKGFLHPNTVAKTKILGKDYLETLLEEIDIHMIPKEYGGKGVWKSRVGNIPERYPIQLMCPYDGFQVP